MQDAVNNTPGVDGQPFRVTLNRAAFSPGDMLSSDRYPRRVYALDEDESDQTQRLMYMRGIDPVEAPGPVITGSTLIQEWANRELASREAEVREQTERAFRDMLITGQVENPAGEIPLPSYVDAVREHRYRSMVEWNPQPPVNLGDLRPAGNLGPIEGEVHPSPEPGILYSSRDAEGWRVADGRGESLVDRMRPIQDEVNQHWMRLQDMQDRERRPHVRLTNERRGAALNTRVFSPDEESEWDELAARADAFEHSQRIEENKKKMETAVKERKSIYKHRFSEAPWFEWLKKREVIVLGAGGIGSWVVFALARIGCTLHVYDMDTIEAHNLGGQMYNMNQVNQNKAEAISRLAMEFSGNEADISTYGRFDEEAPIGPIVISCFDNMAGRQLAFQKWSEALASDPENAAEYLFIDGRLLAEDYQVYSVIGGRLDAYRKTLFEDGEVADAACSFKATTHCSMGIASDMVSVLANHAANRALGIDVREVPFSIIKSIPLFSYDLNFGADEHPQEVTDSDPVPAL